jgi:cytochrome d ubiquinol oxidase subunit II
MVELWFAIFWIMVATYLILDGRTLGAGALRPFVSANPDERQQVLDAIGPMWSWHEVWLLGAGGVLLLAFPSVFAATFSGYYLALFLVLWLLVVRGISIELLHYLHHPLWDSLWNFALAVSSALLIVVLGVALGNIVRGVPLDEHGEFHLAFFTDFGVRGRVGLLDWYTLLIGAFNLAGLGAHGATFLTSKTVGSVRERSKAKGKWLWSATLVLGIAVTLATRVVRPDLWSGLGSRPLPIAFLLVAAGGAVALFAGSRSDRDGMAFTGSCTLIAGLLGARASASFPILLYSTLEPRDSVTAFAAASQHQGLAIAFVWWLIAAPIAVTWHVLANRSFRGRVGGAGSSRPPELKDRAGTDRGGR